MSPVDPFAVGGAAGTVAKTISAYDMTFPMPFMVPVGVMSAEPGSIAC